MLLGRLTPNACQRFAEWLNAGAIGSAPDLLTGDGSSEEVPWSVDLWPQVFATKYEFAQYLASKIEDLPPAAIDYDAGVWNWLALFFIDSICPRDSAGVRKPLAVVHYVLDPRPIRYHRHLVRTPVILYRDFGETARGVLNGPAATAHPPSVHGDAVEQFAGGGDLIRSEPRFEAGAKLYVDSNTHRVKRGALTRGVRGALRRFKDVLKQLARTYDLDGMTSDQVLELMPSPEFDSFPPAQATGAFAGGKTTGKTPRKGGGNGPKGRTRPGR